MDTFDNIRFRVVGASDREALGQLFVDCFSSPPWNEPWTVSGAVRRLSPFMETSTFRGAAATDGDKLVGMLLGQIEGWIDGDLFLIQEMCVAPNRQNAGIGTRLLDYALAQVTATDQVSAAYLLTDGESRGEAFYSRYGFCRSRSKVVLNLRLKQLAGHR